MSGIFVSLRAAWEGLYSLIPSFNTPKKPQRRRYRISLAQLIKQCKKGNSHKTVYQRILSKRLAQLHHTAKKNTKITNNNNNKNNNNTKTQQITKKKVPRLTAVVKHTYKRSSHIPIHSSKPKSPTPKQTPKSKLTSSDPGVKTERKKCECECKQEYSIKQESSSTQESPYNFGCEEYIKTIPCFIPDAVYYDRYAPSAPAWTPPPSPRRNSVTDIADLPICLPYQEPTNTSFPPPNFSVSADERVLMPPPPVALVPTAPPISESLYPRLAPLKTLSPQPPKSTALYPPLYSTPKPTSSSSKTISLYTSLKGTTPKSTLLSASSSTPATSKPHYPPVSSPPPTSRRINSPGPSTASRLQFAQSYIPQVKTNVAYVRPPPYSPDLPYSPHSPYSRPAPYSPTSQYSHNHF